MDPALLLENQLELVSSTTVAGTFYGIAFVLYCLYLHASLSQLRDHDRRRRTQFMITYSTIIMICGLYYHVSNAWVVQDAYIQHSDFPGGPLLYEESIYNTQPVIAVGFVCELVIDTLTAAIQIWRLWVVWSSTRYARLVVVLPVLCLLSFTALHIKNLVFDITEDDANLADDQEITLFTAESALRITATIFPTVLIAGFLIYENRRQRKLIGKSQASNPYMIIIAILVESYALESIWIILYAILYSLTNPVEQIFNDTLIYIEIIAYFLVLYRVAKGRSYGSQGVREPLSQHDNIGSLHWNHTTTQSGVTNVTDTNTHQLSGSEIRPEANTLKAQGSPV